MDLIGKVAIVTGASTGIGRAYALALAGAGAVVVAAARTLTPASTSDVPSRSLAEVVAAAEPLSGRVFAQVCDLEVEEDVVRLVGSTVANFDSVDVLVNNAALMAHYDPLSVTVEEWERAVRTNVRGPYLAIREVGPHMIRQRVGSIVNITARAAGFVSKGDRAHDGTLVYAITKAALNRLTFFMAEELREYGIAVNALSPGVVRTDRAVALRPESAAAPPGKVAAPEVLGPALLCLAQQTAETLTGQILHSDDFGTTWP